MTLTEPSITINENADFWREKIGVNTIPANTRKKETYESWKEWQDKPIPEELHNEWKASGAFNNGIAIILGKVWHNPHKANLYLIGIDLDNQCAIKEVAVKGLEDLAQHVIVEHIKTMKQRHTYYFIHTIHHQRRAVTKQTLTRQTGFKQTNYLL